MTPLITLLVWFIIVIVLGYVVVLLLSQIPGLPAIVPTLVWVAVALICLGFFLQLVGSGHFFPRQL
jgi:hypothetical protein